MKPEIQISPEFADHFKLEEIQQIQDLFAHSNGIASIITFPDGRPITKPSNIGLVCCDSICTNSADRTNCYKYASIIGNPNRSVSSPKTCVCRNFLAVGARITVGENHLADWLIGPLQNTLIDKQKMNEYANRISISLEAFKEMIDQVPILSTEQFNTLSEKMLVITNELSEKANINLITNERDKSATLLSLSKNSYQIIKQAAMDGFLILDMKGQLLEVNEAYCQMSGYSKDELLTLNIIELEANESTIDTTAHIEKILKHGEDRFDTVHRRKDGSLFDVEIKVQYQPLEGGLLVAFLHDITMRKQSAETLRRSEALHAKMVANIGDVIVIIDQEGINTYKSPNVEKWFGWKPEELVGFNALENIHEDDLDSAKGFIGKIFSEPNTTGTIEIRYRNKDGSYIWIEFTGVNLLNDPDIGGILGNYHNIAKRKLAEQALSESNTNYRALFNNLTVGFALHEIILNADGNPCDYRFLEVNSTFEKLTGLNASNLINKTALEVLPNTETYWIETYGRVALTGVPVNFVNYSKDLNRHFQVNSYSPERGKFVTVFLDVTKSKQVELSLIAAKNQAEELLWKTQKQNAEIELNNERLESLVRISQYNPVNMQDFLDYTLNEAINLTSSKIGYIYYYNENTKLFTLNAWSNGVMAECAVINQQTTYELDKTGFWGEAVRQRKPMILNNFQEHNPYQKGIPHGHIQLIRFLTIPVFIDNLIVAVVGVANKENDYLQSDVRQLTLLMDTAWRISERENMISDLEIAKEKAIESDRLKSAFLANMSHEIRTPMNGILGFAELLKEPGLKDEMIQDYVGIIEKSGVRMLNIINDIVDISKIESGQMKITISQTNVNKQIEFLNIFFQPEATRKGIKLSFKTDLPFEKADINTDSEKVYAVLTNLIKNSIKYTDSGSIEFGYKLKKQNDRAELEFFVKDTGIGVPQKQQAFIFERFRQGNEAVNRAYEGAGLGLAIAKSYVDMLGGKIWIESEPVAGTTFYFTLPCNFETKENSVMKKEVITDSGKIQIKGLKILIAEDDEISEMLIENTIKEYSKVIFHVNTGAKAVETCRNIPDIDLILMDIRMPDMDGYEATRQIRKFNTDVVIIAQTAFALAGDREMAIAAGCTDYVSKPIDKATVQALIWKYFNKGELS
jgi:PAS domain S-box-containing protein